MEIVIKNKQINRSQKFLNEIKTQLQEAVSILDFTCLKTFAENSTKNIINDFFMTNTKKSRHFKSNVPT